MQNDLVRLLEASGVREYLNQLDAAIRDGWVPVGGVCIDYRQCARYGEHGAPERWYVHTLIRRDADATDR